MHKEWIRLPQNEGEWKAAASEFERKHHFPHCVGAIDGKHVVLVGPYNGGSMYYNYKGTHSIVLMAVADANLKFSYIDVGAFGRNSDGGVFSSCSFGKALEARKLRLPPDEKIPNVEDAPELPYVFVADEAFPLHKNIMRPYPGRGQTRRQQIFNYRQSRARRVVENAFGVLSARWRVFHTRIAIQPRNAVQVVKAACVLHNYLQAHSTPAQVHALTNEENWPARRDLANIGYRGTNDAIWVREMYADHFNDNSTPEMSAFQNHHIRRGGHNVID